MALKTALLSGHCRKKKFFEEFVCRSGTGCETARVSVVLVSELKGLELASVFHPADDFVLHQGQIAPGHCGTHRAGQVYAWVAGRCRDPDGCLVLILMAVKQCLILAAMCFC